MNYIPKSSNIVCLGENRDDRVCRVQNLCYDSGDDSLFVLKGPHSLWIKVPPLSNATGWTDIVDQTTIRNHNVFFQKLEIRQADYFESIRDSISIRIYDDSLVPSVESAKLSEEQVRLTIVKEPTLLMRRFFPFNVMHILHDDWLGYAEQWELWSLDQRSDGRLVVYDHHHDNPHDQIYNWLGPEMKRIESLMGWPHWVSNGEIRRKEFVCFEDAFIGNPKRNSWYQYGYWEPQGPLTSSTATGWRIRDICSKVLERLNLKPWDRAMQSKMLKAWQSQELKTLPTANEMKIAIISRKINRLILNESELKKSLESEFELPVVFLRMEEMNLTTVLGLLRSTAIAFGMHGSLISMAMFMPPGSILVEGFPYRVPPENYTPYKTMCQLDGMLIIYRAWSCSNISDTVGHPERSPAQGGINHLTDEQRRTILESTTIKPHLCCSDPHWLYRIYQDTRVDIPGVIALIKEAITEAQEKLHKEIT